MDPLATPAEAAREIAKALVSALTEWRIGLDRMRVDAVVALLQDKWGAYPQQVEAVAALVGPLVARAVQAERKRGAMVVDEMEAEARSAAQYHETKLAETGSPHSLESATFFWTRAKAFQAGAAALRRGPEGT
jgi:hypothetical protein